MLLLIIGALFSTQSCLILADTPANCTYDDARGLWQFDMSEYRPNCSVSANTIKSIQIDLLYPNKAVDEFGREGNWTMIYNQGFEVEVGHRKWLVKYAYIEKTTFFCDRGIPIWTHDNLIRQWNCSVAHKINPTVNVNPRQSSIHDIQSTKFDEPYRMDQDFIDLINTVQKSWKAVSYAEYANLTLRGMLLMSGGRLSSTIPDLRVNHVLKRLPYDMHQSLDQLPSHFNWRTQQPSPVTPVRHQLQCGSCYAFASAGAMEARIRLATNFTDEPILSPQDIVDCNPYSEGCKGGFPYLTAGKYAEDFGVATEDCVPYKGREQGFCPTREGCKLYYSTNYRYIGGYYGATNAELMQHELVHNGPIPVSMMVHSDLYHYKEGVYRHTQLENRLNDFHPFMQTNHVVLIVGYGVDETSGEPYWDVKNSWGPQWGDHGFFKILRGNDECAIESCAVAFDPVI